MVPYRELLTGITQRVGVSTDEAREAAEATIATMARTLDDPQRERLLAAVPARLSRTGSTPEPAPDAESFVAEVSDLTGVTLEQARYRAQAVLTALAEQDPDLVGSLDLPVEVRGLVSEPAPGGGLVAPTGGTAPLSAQELSAALADRPDWSGDPAAIRRTVTLPPEDLAQVLARLDALREEAGRAPEITRAGDTAVLTVRTASVDAVTALDLDLVRRIDEIIAEGPPDVGA